MTKGRRVELCKQYAGTRNAGGVYITNTYAHAFVFFFYWWRALSSCAMRSGCKKPKAPALECPCDATRCWNVWMCEITICEEPLQALRQTKITAEQHMLVLATTNYMYFIPKRARALSCVFFFFVRALEGGGVRLFIVVAVGLSSQKPAAHRNAGTRFTDSTLPPCCIVEWLLLLFFYFFGGGRKDGERRRLINCRRVDKP